MGVKWSRWVSARFSETARQTLDYVWQGPADLPPSLRLEWRFVAIRWLGMMSVAPGILFANLSRERLIAAYGVLLVAAIYNFTVQRSMQRHPALFANGYITAVGDGLLNVAMVAVGGGYSTPFYYILFTVTISAAMRYGYGPAFAMAMMYVTFDILEDPSNLASRGAPFLFRSGFLCITAILAGYLREQTRRAEAALAERLRQANLLNEATATLGVSLEFEPVLEAVAAAGAHLLGSRCAVLLPSPRLEADNHNLLATIHYPASEPTALHHELATICRRHLGEETSQRERERPFYLESLPYGGEAMVLVLALATRQNPMATLALVRPSEGSAPPVATDILESFIERSTLAIENASLYRTLASRGNALQRAYAELAEAHQELLSLDEMKTNFLANVSHELRTPLNSIRAFTELLLTYDDDEEVQKEFLQIINSESERLTRLINDVLDVVKIESGHMDWSMKKIDLVTVLLDTARTYEPLIARQGLIFQIEVPDNLPPVQGDRDRLQQVLGNLINNASKFTQEGSITLGARCVGDEVQISVSDTGIGVAPEDQERIFDKFQQVGDTLTDKPKGTGLGLAICRDILSHHNGRIWVESEPGVGSSFVFTLPLAGEPIRPPEKIQELAEAVLV